MNTAQAMARVCITSVALVTAVGCGSGASKIPTPNAAAGSTSAPAQGSPAAQASSASPVPSAPAPTAGAPSAPTTTAGKPQQATGGGDFCKAIAASLNRPSAATGTTPAEMGAQLAVIRKDAQQAASLAPESLKADVNRLMAASLAVWDALAKVNYDYTKITASDMTALSTPAVAAAEKRLTAYMTNTCGLSIGSPASH
jgi:hypothetical protein